MQLAEPKSNDSLVRAEGGARFGFVERRRRSQINVMKTAKVRDDDYQPGEAGLLRLDRGEGLDGAAL